MKKIGLKELVKSLLHIEDSPERTALAFSIGAFLGFSPFLGLHTLAGLAVAFLFRLNRVAVLLGVWSNAPWWIIPYYTLATSAGMWLTGYRIESSALREVLRLGRDQGLFDSSFWNCLASQWGFLWSFTIGSLILAFLLALATYPLARAWIRFYRHKRNSGDR
jgi:uncharacterized protein